jgi:hypothetical protein
MRFQTPQFIGIEDKIFGPFTLKQFIYLAGSALLSFIIYRFLPGFISFFLILPILGLGAALAFYKVNKKPFIFVLEASFKYFMTNKLYLWQRKPKKEKEEVIEKTEELVPSVPKLSEGKLKDLAWSLDVNDLSYDRDKPKVARTEVTPKHTR